MGRIATTADEQIECLKSRGMNLDYPESKIKEFLLDIGYYRLGFYWNPFEINEEHDFCKGAKFSDVIKLYYLDVDIRNLLLRFTSRIEINFRTLVVYHVSNKYKNSPTWFADPTIVEYNFINKLYNAKDRCIYNSDFIRCNKVIKKHHAKYINDRFAPAWKTLEYFTFGVILDLYRNIKDTTVKKEVALSLGFRDIDKFTNYMAIVVLMRNNCAHGDVLFDMNLPKAMLKVPFIQFNNNNRSSFHSCLQVIHFFMSQISANRAVEFESTIDKLFNQFKDNSILKDIIIQKSNYLFH